MVISGSVQSVLCWMAGERRTESVYQVGCPLAVGGSGDGTGVSAMAPNKSMQAVGRFTFSKEAIALCAPKARNNGHDARATLNSRPQLMDGEC